MDDLIWQVGPIGFFLLLGFFVGRYRERRHFAALNVRERQFSDVGIVNLKAVTNPGEVKNAALVMGDAVIATDYFKGFVSKLRGLIGGEIGAYVTLMERARREATLRLLQQAREMGATEVWNVRYETSNIRSSGRNNPGVSVEVFAFGTAITREPKQVAA